MALSQPPQELLDRLSRAAESVKGFPEVRIVSHYDADGIASAGVLCNALLRENIQFQVSLSKALDEESISQIADNGYECIVFSDMGSGHLERLEELGSEVVVLDHHRPPRDSQELHHLNPHLHQVDGMTGCSASSMCMLFALTMDEGNWPLLPIALAGVSGDRQDIKGLSGFNQYLFQEGESRGLVERRSGSLVPDGPVEEGLLHSFDPYIVGITGNKRGIRELLERAGVDPGESIDEVDQGRKRKLHSLLSLRLLDQGVEASTLIQATRERLYLPSWEMDSGRLSSLLNACGRMGKEGLGVALTLGDGTALEEATVSQTSYCQEVISALEQVRKEGISQREHIQYLYSPHPSLSGVVCGITMEYLAPGRKPTMAFSRREGKVKVSGRANFPILEMGVDLSEALSAAAGAVGGSGGGHSIASGASVPQEREAEFLEELDRIVGEQKASPSR
ncbi:MAG: DHHA1 domain-containing protein [Thermoplasmatota archaeon]